MPLSVRLSQVLPGSVHPPTRCLTADQCLDFDTVEWVVQSMLVNGQIQVQELGTRYPGAPLPGVGPRATMGSLRLDGPENWTRLELYQHWRSENNETLGGTNNLMEQGIGQYVKARYRTMREQKCKVSIVKVSRFIGRVRGKRPDYRMTE